MNQQTIDKIKKQHPYDQPANKNGLVGEVQTHTSHGLKPPDALPMKLPPVFCDLYGIRTHVFSVKRKCPWPLDEKVKFFRRHSSIVKRLKENPKDVDENK